MNNVRSAAAMGDRLKLYSTLSRKIEPLETIEPGIVRMYICGVTPYDNAHIGHAMSAIVFDTIRRYLEHRGYEVRHVVNFTDIDDKIIVRAQREGIAASELTERLIADWHREREALGVLPATVYPRATQEIPAIVTMIEGLIERGYAYEADGDVYFRVRAFEDYGKLSGRNVDDMVSGARIEIDERKEDPLDFALWKAAKPGEPTWPSPWSDGRPGWHIECSAMCSHYLNGQVDIHGGGTDLIFPHHENEIAQSEAFLGVEPFSRYWMHNGMLQLGGDKMSKSIGNVIRIKDLIEGDQTQAFRLMVLQSHYRAPLTFSEESLEAAGRGLERLITAARPVEASAGSGEVAGLELAAQHASDEFHAAMNDDFNSPAAIAALFDLARTVNRARDAGASCDEIELGRAKLVELAGVLGLDLESGPESFGDAAPYIDLLVAVRDRLRAEKQWALTDLIRDQLAEKGIAIADGPSGSTWQKI
ncbi:MAG TPA: cysteine--tRNA ligase [Thermomicrobiales bacterium]|nr:cysteine--tRNA ligase [Thermomicrobiales bacterium]